MAERFAIGCVQMRSGTGEAANIETMRALVREAAGCGATYVQTPEMTGLIQRRREMLLREISPDDGNPVFEAAAALAGELGIWLHVGSTAIAVGDEQAANRGALFAPDGTRVAVYDKMHMFDVDLDNGESWRESGVYRPGTKAVVVDGPPVCLGMAICYDLRFPGLFRGMAQAGAALLTAPSCFTRQTGEAHWQVLLRARAIENGAFMVAAAQGGKHEDGRESFGHSMIVDPWGTILGELDHDEPGVLVREIDPGMVAQARAKIPSLRHDRTFSVQRVSAPSVREVASA